LFCLCCAAQLWFYDAQRRIHPFVAPNKVLDLTVASNPPDGTPVQIWAASGQRALQVWSTNVPSLTAGFLCRQAAANLAIRSAANCLCLDVYAYNYANGAPVVMWPCNGANNQRWQLNTLVGTLSSTHNPAKCLDANSGNQGGWTLLRKKIHGGTLSTKDRLILLLLSFTVLSDAQVRLSTSTIATLLLTPPS
jgi:hypothetical protein